MNASVALAGTVNAERTYYDVDVENRPMRITIKRAPSDRPSMGSLRLLVADGAQFFRQPRRALDVDGFDFAWHRDF